MNKDSLGDRMKSYEDAFRHYLPPRMPVIIRVDGKNFHSYARKCKKPFDENLMQVMSITAQTLCTEIQNTCCAYVQSDEISLVLNNYKNFGTQSWFDNNIQKMASVSASIAAATFTANSGKIWDGNIKPAYFDSRMFILPEREVCNYLLWRQQDASRNSVQMLARSIFSHKECLNKNVIELKEMCESKGQPWESLHPHKKQGVFIIRNDKCGPTWALFENTPSFRSEDFKSLIQDLLSPNNELFTPIKL